MIVFNEFTKECDITAHMYASGLEKKEIAEKKFRAISTITNQLKTAYEKLNIRNGRELTMKFYERLSGIKVSLDISDATRVVVASVLLMLFVIDMSVERQDMRRSRRSRVEIERLIERRVE